MTLIDPERRNSLVCVFPPNSTDFQVDYITVVEDRPTISIKYRTLLWRLRSRKL